MILILFLGISFLQFSGAQVGNPAASVSKPAPAASAARLAKVVTDLKLTLNGRSLPVNSVDLKKRVANHLYDRPLEERAEVWSLMAQLNGMIDKANDKLTKSTSRSLTDVEGLWDDILLHKEDIEDLIESYKKYPELLTIDGGTPRARHALISIKARKWTMPIRYRVKGPSSSLIKKAVEQWEKHTCIRFKKRSGLTLGSHLVFRNNKKGCYSSVGRKIKIVGQTINLGRGCQTLGIVIHEIAHALGFWHEQNRPDRNSYVRIYKDNLKDPKSYHNFVRVLWSQSRTYGIPYDYGSIMHYGMYAFAKPGKKTIVPKESGYERTIGQSNELSFYDAKAANFHYCESKCSGGLEWSNCKNGGYKNPNKCSVCKCPDGWSGTDCTTPATSKPTSSSCGNRTLDAKSSYRELTSPGYNSGGYSASHECSWLITAPTGKRVQFQFQGTFKIRCNRVCKDYVEVRYRNLVDVGSRYCCSSRPTTAFKSTGRQMLINFRTFSGSKERGFKARYRYY